LIVEEYVQGTNGKLTMHFLPGYAPDLNPDELVWSYAKRSAAKRGPLKSGEKLQPSVDEELTKIKENPVLVRQFFKHPTVSYISDL
jgi:transposase